MKRVLLCVFLASAPAYSLPYNIPSGDVGRALVEWGKQTGLEFLLLLSVDKPTHNIEGVVGDFHPLDALTMLLAQTCLQVEWQGPREVAFRPGGSQCAWIIYPGGHGECVPVLDRTEWGPCPFEPGSLREKRSAQPRSESHGAPSVIAGDRGSY